MGYFGVAFLMALESACIPVPSELIMPYAGFLVSKGSFGFWQIVFWGTVGQTFGSIVTYWIGATEGRILLEKYGKYVLIKKSHIEHADKWFDKFGPRVVFFGRMVPVIRTFISLPAGLSEMSFSKFVLYSVLGIIPWTIFLGYLGVYLGDNWNSLKVYFHGADAIVFGAIIGGAGYLIYKNLSRKA
ncbi:MAG: hypothetical protein UU65_C0002G0060 [candidate division CPR2 bacterium GW2011_GWC1_41_48]|uniref:VTT domain-containing protein n=1 Tax=candidate division CPR2 bacterium GW2011_GWC1_41_48 TaxID=1618344 RepID=A0A0G0WB31_UNCC2|nr:MAG: hypothetical protein UT47_C0002G0244 [candidate division CPR2 bacterium GW2011_GWC2_39_35]KKR27345.1 MAG: hypothetical protein UT59_C0060G0005 [candidate division CPR2 bacterium GW2011_GWD1_39_7]KKR29103.1 MAG: hypothetical protein UT60_C0007G0048 [candidate division CPR2 bacterium GW2011_GWD2_39_7]KKS09282.1 MAG: hypothetical protein UU65_C0002G0060 [candidate division CPR2 bacterium GW2011_GWC1_41_48]